MPKKTVKVSAGTKETHKEDVETVEKVKIEAKAGKRVGNTAKSAGKGGSMNRFIIL